MKRKGEHLGSAAAPPAGAAASTTPFVKATQWMGTSPLAHRTGRRARSRGDGAADGGKGRAVFAILANKPARARRASPPI